MKGWGLLAACSTLAACASIAQPIQTDVPILVGPVDHIRGRANPQPDEPPLETKFAGENTMSLWIVWGAAYPSLIATQPNAGADVLASIGEAYARLAGHDRLDGYTPRLASIGTGAWISFFSGTYGHKWWWSTDGAIERAR